MNYNIVFYMRRSELFFWGLFLTAVIIACIFFKLEFTAGVVLSALLSFICAAFLSSFRSESGFFSAPVVCIAALFLYSMSVPLHHLVYLDYDSEGINFVTTMCVVALLGQVLGYCFMIKSPFSIKMDMKNELQFGLIILFLGVVTVIAAISLTVGFTAYFDAGYAGRALLKREVGPVELGLYYAVVGYLFIVYAWLFKLPKKKKLMWSIFIVFFLFAFVGYVSLLGIRRPSFFMVLSSLFLYFLKVKGRVPKKIILISFGCAFLFGIFASFRQVLSDHGVRETLLYISTHFNFSWLDLSSSELGAPFRAMLQIKEEWFSEGLQWGRSYVDAFINIVPSSILKFRDSLSVQYTNEFFPAEYIAIGGNMGFFPVAEAYLNFSIMGVLIEFFCLGLLIKYIERMAIKQYGAVYSVAYAIMIPWYFFFLRTDFSSFLKSFFYSVLPVFFVCGFYCVMLLIRQRYQIRIKKLSYHMINC